MASRKEYLHFILEQLSDLDGVSYRPMMENISSTTAVESSAESMMIGCLSRKQDPLWNLCLRQFVSFRMRARKKCCW